MPVVAFAEGFSGKPPLALPDAPEADALSRKIRVVLANHSHLDRVVHEAFQIARRTQQEQKGVEFVDRPYGGEKEGKDGPVAPSVTYVATVDLVCGILRKIELPCDRAQVQAWVAACCSTFAKSRQEADAMTCARVGIAADWTLRCLADQQLRANPRNYYHRKFLSSFEQDKSLEGSGLQLGGPVAHGLFGNIWLHVKMKMEWVRRVSHHQNRSRRSSHALSSKLGSCSEPLSQISRRHSATGAQPAARGSVTSETLGFLPAVPDNAAVDMTRRQTTKQLNSQRYLVVSVSKSLCRLPPELLSSRIREMIDMEPLPYVLPLLDAFEDLEHIHLVYEGIAPQAICLTDKVFDDMHRNEDDHEGGGFCERTVQQVVWKLMSTMKQAHGRGFVHGCLRIGGCYLNDAESFESLKILEFGLYQLFELPEALPPLAVLTPTQLDPADPVPPYRRDLQSVAELMYLMLGGQPLCVPGISSEERFQRFRMGAACFSDRVFLKTSENAKAFVLELLRPTHFKKNRKMLPSHEAYHLMSHKWFLPPKEGDEEQMDEVYDVLVMRKFDTWRNTLRWQINLMKLVADRISLAGVFKLEAGLAAVAGKPGKVSWNELEVELQMVCPLTYDLLKRVNKAFGENSQARTIDVRDLGFVARAWRRKRVREVLWQVFRRAKAVDGMLTLEACQVGLTNSVLHVWSRPCRVVEVLFPSPGPGNASESELDGRLKELLVGCPSVNFLDLLTQCRGL